ncbi:unnamed protein product [Microthlaspi erraticum]|uniref:VHS domain-containing protein n=1 Tax=Microthlaspi erraticum TaxID=1685480 RepID=A0A6D2K5S3_9BRAS|nr:unnamed protein product [Microthlaspi erraticum]
MASSSASATVAVEKATSDLLLGPDWTTNMEICDSVNSLHWQAKDVVKAVKKRLQHKSPRVQQLALTLLETLVKNCGDYLHHQVAEKNVLGEMVKIVKKKADMQVRDKILVMIDSWQQAFGGPEGKYPQYYWAYDELRRSGVEFPRRSPDASPIITPPVSHPIVRQPQGGYGSPQAGYGAPQAGYGPPPAGYGPPPAGYGPPPAGYGPPPAGYGPSPAGYGMPQAGYGAPSAGYGVPQAGYGMPSGSSRRLDEAMASEVEGLSLSSLESMRDVMDLLSDMLQAVDPSDRAAVKDEVIVDLVERCRSNQKKLMQMLTSTGDDELLGRGLDLNDCLQIQLAKHDAIASGSPLPVQALKPADSSPKSSQTKDSSSVAGSSSPIPATVSTGKSPIDEEYEEEEDEFAQLARRHSKPPASVATDPTSSASNALALALPDPPPPVNTTKEQDMIDLLSITLSTPPTPPPPSSQPPPSTVSDQNTNIYPQPPQQQYGNYVAPWAQQPQQQQQPQTQQGYPQPQQQQPQTQQGYSHPQQQPQTQQGYSQQQQPQTQQGYSQQQQPQIQQGYSQPQAQYQMQPASRPQNPYEYPPPPWASTSANAYYTPRANATASYTEASAQAGRSLQQSNSFPTRAGEPQATSAASNPGVNGGQKPFVPSYRLFEDLDVFGSADGKHNKSANSNNASQGLSGSQAQQQSMIGGGRKMI